jgi:lipoprotein-anchoring transpeptidase ErfK/SrfK
LRRGDEGPAVLALQQRLTALGYWLGTPDGTFGAQTLQAVYAVQKTAGLSRDGVVGAKTRAALADGVRPHPRSSSGRVVEIDLERQVLLIVQDGRLLSTLNTSTGSGDVYYVRGDARLAVTPRGHFHVYAQIDGMRHSDLGFLWRPKYFRGGIAVHGSDSVPPWPASHGCVRVSNRAIDRIWAEGLVPIGTPVWVY